jgi:hypothetical protein
LHDSWRYRSERAAIHVRPNAILLDIGCGKMAIERFLPPGCRYVPADVVPRDERTLVCDLNQGRFPPAGGADHVCMLGVLEYVDVPRTVWHWLSQLDARVILSYVPLRATFSAGRRKAMGWLNHFTREEIIQAAENAGFVLTAEEDMPPDTVLFVFDKRVSSK